MKLVSRSGVLAFVLWCGAANPALAQSCADDHRTKVLAIGDSILFETQHYLTWLLEAGQKAEVRVFATSGSAICAWFPGAADPQNVIPTDIESQVREFQPDVVVFQFWGNVNAFAISPCMGELKRGAEDYYARIAADAQAAMIHVFNGAWSAGIAMPKVFWALQPPDPYTQAAPSRNNDSYRALGEDDSWADSVRFPDAGRDVSRAFVGQDRYGYTRWLPCLQGWESVAAGTCRDTMLGAFNVVRDGTDNAPGIHFCPSEGHLDAFGDCSVYSSGALRYALGIAGPILDEFDLH